MSQKLHLTLATGDYARLEALKSYTLDAAYTSFEEEILGSIEPGKLADFAVLSKDIMSIPAEEILQTEAVMTIVGGKVVFKREELSGLTR